MANKNNCFIGYTETLDFSITSGKFTILQGKASSQEEFDLIKSKYENVKLFCCYY